MVSRVLTCRQSQITLLITVLHASNRFAPTPSNPHQLFTVSEHAPVGHLVHNFQYYDPDRDSFSLAFLLGNTDGAFNISDTGELTVARQLNASLLNRYNLEIQAEDHGRPVLTSRYTFTVTVIDENDPPRFIESCAQQSSCVCEIVEQTADNSYICRGLVLGFDFDIRSEYRQIFHKVSLHALPLCIGDIWVIRYSLIMYVRTYLMFKQLLEHGTCLHTYVRIHKDACVLCCMYVCVIRTL